MPKSAHSQLHARPALSAVQRRVAQRVRQAVRLHQLWAPGQGVLLGCSGGADSVAAAVLLAQLRRSLGHRLVLGHVDHGIAADSARAAQLVQQLGESLKVDVLCARIAVPPGADLEGRARTLRYAALAELRQQADCQVVATAHHAGDQAETLLMRASRGAGLDALAGIRTYRSDGVVRPLLQVAAADLHAWQEGQLIWEDPSNHSLVPSRNQLRWRVLPALERAIPGATQGLARTADHLATFEGDALYWVEAALSPAAGRPDGVTLTLPRAAIPLEVRALWWLLRWVAAQLGCPPPSQAAARQVAALAAQAGPGQAAIAGMNVWRDRNQWTFSRPNIARPQGAD